MLHQFWLPRITVGQGGPSRYAFRKAKSICAKVILNEFSELSRAQAAKSGSKAKKATHHQNMESEESRATSLELFFDLVFGTVTALNYTVPAATPAALGHYRDTVCCSFGNKLQI